MAKGLLYVVAQFIGLLLKESQNLMNQATTI